MNSNEILPEYIIQLVIICIIAALLLIFIKPAKAPTQNIVPSPVPPTDLDPIIPPIITLPEEQTTNERYAELLKPTGVLLKTYQENQCELAAKDFQKVYGGNLVFIAPYIPETSAWVRCEYCGHLVNRIYYKNKSLWVDYTNKEVYEKKEHMTQILSRLLQYKFTYTINIKVFVIGEDSLPYPMIWHY